MKKVINLLLICCLIVPCSLMLTACKDDDGGPYSVAGKSFQGSSVCMVDWKEGLTEAEKQAIMADVGAITEEEFCQILGAKNTLVSQISYKYLSDGVVNMTVQTNNANLFYVQSNDKKTVTHYEDEEHTIPFDFEGTNGLKYYNDEFCLMLELTDYSLYFIFNEVQGK